MERRARIPAWLGISWWWLLLIAVVQVELWHLLRLPDLVRTANLVIVWQLGQAWWVWRYSSRGRALYCLAAWIALDLFVNLSHFTAYAASADHWFSMPIVVGAGLFPGLLWLAGILFLAGDLRDYVARTDGAEPVWNLLYVWAILFSAFYFQYKFHELYESQEAEAAKLTPGSA